MDYEKFNSHLRTAVASGRLTEPQAANWRSLFKAHAEWTLEVLFDSLDDPDFKLDAKAHLETCKQIRKTQVQKLASKKPEATPEPLHGVDLVAAAIDKQFEARTATQSSTPKTTSPSGLHGKARIADAINRKFGANGGY